jgi:SOS-response transcriptional repressor LexA
MKRVTARQLQVLIAIDQHRAQFGNSPTMREIGAVVGIKSTNGVADHLHWLEHKGLVDRGADNKSRQTRLTAAGEALLPRTVRAPAPPFAAEQAIEALDLSA